MDEAGQGGGQGGGEDSGTVCVGPEISLPLGVRGEEAGKRSRLVSCMFYHMVPR